MSIFEYLNASVPDLSEEQQRMFGVYFDMLTEWNSRFNLTAITLPQEVAEKHFADSLLPLVHIPKGARCVDVGSGAGFPGLPIKICRPDVELVMIDSLQKRVKFLEAVCAELGLDCGCVHSRAEDAGREPALRESFDIALTRAVAPANALLEWTVPFLRVGGRSLMYKGDSAEDELKLCASALTILGAEARVERYEAKWGKRAVIIAEKKKPTPGKYPRKAGLARKNPL